MNRNTGQRLPHGVWLREARVWHIQTAKVVLTDQLTLTPESGIRLKGAEP
jgi:hypothetical protein